LTSTLRKSSLDRRSELALRFASNLVARLEGSDVVLKQRLIEAFAAVPRERFVEPTLTDHVYEDISLPIGFGQTISRPSTVLLMLAALNIRPGHRVLEVGTGSGYVTAMAAALGAQVWGIERLSFLAQLARRRLDSLGLQTVLVRAGDGRRGWPEAAPFDAIVVSCALDETPEELLSQLKGRGCLVAPMRDRSGEQRLQFWRREETWKCFDLGPCNFVTAR